MCQVCLVVSVLLSLCGGILLSNKLRSRLLLINCSLISIYIPAINPSISVRWLGFWFDQRRIGTIHFQKRAENAAVALRPLHSLSSPAKGLTPQNVWHLVQLVLRPRILYGAAIFSPRKVDLRPLRAAWHSAAHWILGAFRTTPTTSLLIETGLPPVRILLKHARLRYRVPSQPPIQ